MDPTLSVSVACDLCARWYHAGCVGYDATSWCEALWLCPTCAGGPAELAPTCNLDAAGAPSLPQQDRLPAAMAVVAPATPADGVGVASESASDSESKGRGDGGRDLTEDMAALAAACASDVTSPVRPSTPGGREPAEPLLVHAPASTAQHVSAAAEAAPDVPQDLPSPTPLHELAPPHRKRQKLDSGPTEVGSGALSSAVTALSKLDGGPASPRRLAEEAKFGLLAPPEHREKPEEGVDGKMGGPDNQDGGCVSTSNAVSVEDRPASLQGGKEGAVPGSPALATNASISNSASGATSLGQGCEDAGVISDQMTESHGQLNADERNLEEAPAEAGLRAEAVSVADRTISSERISEEDVSPASKRSAVPDNPPASGPVVAGRAQLQASPGAFLVLPPETAGVDPSDLVREPRLEKAEARRAEAFTAGVPTQEEALPPALVVDVTAAAASEHGESALDADAGAPEFAAPQLCASGAEAAASAGHEGGVDGDGESPAGNAVVAACRAAVRRAKEEEEKQQASLALVARPAALPQSGLKRSTAPTRLRKGLAAKLFGQGASLGFGQDRELAITLAWRREAMEKLRLSGRGRVSVTPAPSKPRSEPARSSLPGSSEQSKQARPSSSPRQQPALAQKHSGAVSSGMEERALAVSRCDAIGGDAACRPLQPLAALLKTEAVENCSSARDGGARASPSEAASGRCEVEPQASEAAVSEAARRARAVLARKAAAAGAARQGPKPRRGADEFVLLCQLPTDMRPLLPISARSRVPTGVRQVQLSRFVELHLRRLGPSAPIGRNTVCERAVADALQEEREAFQSSSSKMVYLNHCARLLASSARVVRPPAACQTSAAVASSSEVSRSVASKAEGAAGGCGPLEEPISYGTDSVSSREDVKPSQCLTKPLPQPSKTQVQHCQQPEDCVQPSSSVLAVPTPSEQVRPGCRAGGGTALSREDEALRAAGLLGDDSDDDTSSGTSSEGLAQEKGEEEVQAAAAAAMGMAGTSVSEAPPTTESRDQKDKQTSDVKALSDELRSKECDDAACQEDGLREADTATVPASVATVPDEWPHFDGLEERIESLRATVLPNLDGCSSLASTDTALDADVMHKQILEFVKLQLKPRLRRGNISHPQYKWALLKTTEKVTRHHTGAASTSFLAREEGHICRLAEGYVQSFQKKFAAAAVAGSNSAEVAACEMCGTLTGSGKFRQVLIADSSDIAFVSLS
eukprot:SM000002S05536  [mRNA]  locus=s2:586327:591800:- [translate_table: standard]